MLVHTRSHFHKVLPGTPMSLWAWIHNSPRTEFSRVGDMIHGWGRHWHGRVNVFLRSKGQGLLKLLSRILNLWTFTMSIIGITALMYKIPLSLIFLLQSIIQLLLTDPIDLPGEDPARGQRVFSLHLARLPSLWASRPGLQGRADGQWPTFRSHLAVSPVTTGLPSPVDSAGLLGAPRSWGLQVRELGGAPSHWHFLSLPLR